MSGFHCSNLLPNLIRSITCLSFPRECLGSCCQRLVRLYTEASPSPTSPSCTALHCARTMGKALL